MVAIKVSDPTLLTPSDYSKVRMELFEKDGTNKYKLRYEAANAFLQLAADLVIAGASLDFNTLAKIEAIITDMKSVSNANGFEDDQRAQTLLTYVNGTRQFTIAPAAAGFHFYELGNRKDIVGAKSVVWTNVEGEHWVFFENAVLKVEANPSQARREQIILNYAFVASFFWDVTNQKVVVDLSDERHGTSMSPRTHLYMHLTRGAQWVNGFGLGNIVADAAGSLATHAQFSVESGRFFDEDLEHNGITLAVGSTIPVVYNLGATPNLRSDVQNNFAVLNAPSGRLYFNEFTGGAWQRTEVTNGNFVLYHMFCFNGVSSKTISVMGQAQYATLVAARDGAQQEVANIISALPFPELVPIGTVIYETRTTYTNAVKARIRTDAFGDTYVDWRSTELAQGSPSTSHINLLDKQIAANGVEWGHVDNAKPLQIPELTTVARDLVVPRAGMVIYNTTTGEFEIYTGTSWVVILNSLGASVASATNLAPVPTADAFPVTGTTTINAIVSTNWKIGRTIKLQFAGACIITHNGTVTGDNKKIILKKAGNYTTVANDVLVLWYNGTSWYEVNDLTKEAGGGGAGGHVIQENSVSMTARTKLNFVTANSEDVVKDDAANDQTDIEMTLKSLNDFSATGLAAGNLVGRNAGNTGFEPKPTAPFTDILRSSEANINVNGILSTFVPAGYKIDSIILKNQTANAAGNVSIGTAAAGTQIVNAATVGASAVVDATLVEDFPSDVNDTDLYVSSSAWGTGIITIYFTFKKII